MMNTRQPGFTLVEMIIVLVVGSVVLGAVYNTINTQERTNRQQIAVVTTEQNNRMVLEVIQSDLREVSAADSDLIEAGTQRIRFRALRKAGIVCHKDFANGTWANVAPLGQAFAMANGGTPADSLLIFADGATNTANDDSWMRGQISNVQNATCSNYPLGNVQQIQLTGGLTFAQVDSGALIRSFKDVSYTLVNETSNGTLKGTLYRANGTDSVAIVNDLKTIADEGVKFRYFDASGTEITPNTQALRNTVMRIEIKVKGTYAGGQTGANRMFTDSLMGDVFLRGNRKTS